VADIDKYPCRDPRRLTRDRERIALAGWLANYAGVSQQGDTLDAARLTRATEVIVSLIRPDPDGLPVQPRETYDAPALDYDAIITCTRNQRLGRCMISACGQPKR
jgi:hypothetical protein